MWIYLAIKSDANVKVSGDKIWNLEFGPVDSNRYWLPKTLQVYSPEMASCWLGLPFSTTLRSASLLKASLQWKRRHNLLTHWRHLILLWHAFHIDPILSLLGTCLQHVNSASGHFCSSGYCIILILFRIQILHTKAKIEGDEVAFLIRKAALQNTFSLYGTMGIILSFHSCMYKTVKTPVLNPSFCLWQKSV